MVDVTALATTGATTLVGLMVSETWNQARARVARFFARGEGEGTGPGGGADGPEEGSAQARALREAEAALEESRRELAEARDTEDEDAVRDIEGAWRQRFRRVLRESPGAARELRTLLAELGPEPARTGPGDVSHTISGVVHGNVVMARDITELTLHAPGDRPWL